MKKRIVSALLALCLLASLLPFTEKIWKQMRRPGRA